MKGYCTFYHKSVLSEADCYFCKIECGLDFCLKNFWADSYKELSFKEEIIRLFYKYLNKFTNWYKHKKFINEK
jgi:hypothetical protein